MEREEEVFLEAEEEVTPRRSGRKRRSTAGSTPLATTKKPRSTKMPTERSPKKGPRVPTSGGPDPDQDGDAFWKKMGGDAWRDGSKAEAGH